MAAGLTVLTAAALSATQAKADQWCGYATHDNAVVECGYTTASDCESAVGKGGMCFVDPDLAQNLKRPAGAINSKVPTHGQDGS